MQHSKYLSHSHVDQYKNYWSKLFDTKKIFNKVSFQMMIFAKNLDTRMLKYHHWTMLNFWILACTLVQQFSNVLSEKRKRDTYSQRGVTSTLESPLTSPLSKSRLLLDGRYCVLSIGLNLVSVSTLKCKNWSIPGHLALVLGNHICCLGIVAAATPTKLPNQTSRKQPRLLFIENIELHLVMSWNHLYSQLSLKGHLSKPKVQLHDGTWLVTPFCWLIATRQTPMENAHSV